jgi:hypothetical protein
MRFGGSHDDYKDYSFGDVIPCSLVDMYRRAPVSTDSVPAVYRGPKKNLKIKEIKGM